MTRRAVRALARLGVAALAWPALAAERGLGPERPFGPGERVTLRVSWARLQAGRAHLSVERGEPADVLRFVLEARSEGFFAWLARFKVRDRTVAVWDAGRGCSLGIEKHLREGRAARDQVVRFDPERGVAEVEDAKIRETRFEVGGCPLDILSAIFVMRERGVPADGSLQLPVFDNGKRYLLGFRVLGRETLNLPAPLGKKVPTLIVEPQLVEGSGLFVKQGRLKLWLTDDARRIPVRLRSRAAVGSVSAELESYEPPEVIEQGGAASRPLGPRARVGSESRRSRRH